MCGHLVQGSARAGAHAQASGSAHVGGAGDRARKRARTYIIGNEHEGERKRARRAAHVRQKNERLRF